MTYILDAEGQPVPEPDLLKWAKWFGSADRVIAQDWVRVGGTTVKVSTVFLGMDHGWGGETLLYETMIFGLSAEDDQWRYSTVGEARAGHARALAWVQGLADDEGDAP